jgi:hypothetical protein
VFPFKSNSICIWRCVREPNRHFLSRKHVATPGMTKKSGMIATELVNIPTPNLAAVLSLTQKYCQILSITYTSGDEAFSELVIGYLIYMLPRLNRRCFPLAVNYLPAAKFDPVPGKLVQHQISDDENTL